MTKRVIQKGRFKKTRRRKNIILIGAEGKNKTEKNYFTDLSKDKNKDYVIHYAKGNYTDPCGIVNGIIQSIKQEELDFDNGDYAFYIFDTDVNKNKQKEIDIAIKKAKENHIEIIISNPCFEVWFLQHFRYSTKSYLSNEEVLKELNKYIENYDKSKSYYDLLKDKKDIALFNSIKLAKHHEELDCKQDSLSKNPSTDVYKIVELF